MANKTRVIAFYLPQFYPTPENDKWWCPGFTEWTNVAKARPLFHNHYQPRLPGELGFYDLRLPFVREQQAKLARIAGIEGFCYWHYWFGNGKRLLDRVFHEVVESGSPDFPFCLCWANHSWYSKTWNKTKQDVLLIEQTYPGVDDYVRHFNEMLPAFKDRRYIRVNGKLLFGIFAPFDIPDAQLFMDTWNRLARENDLVGFEFFAFVQGDDYLKKMGSAKFDRIVYDAFRDVDAENKSSLYNKTIGSRKKHWFNIPLTIDYDFYTDRALRIFQQHPEFTPCIDPDFDHTPRSGAGWVAMKNSTPQKWGAFCAKIDELLKNRADDILFVKAWNEWGEGNYLEPDQKYGRGYINEMAKVFNNSNE